MTLPRVFFDGNSLSVERTFWLGFDQSREDLKALGAELREGMRVTIYEPDDFEMDAILRFDAKEDVWWADAIEGTLRSLDGNT